MRWRLASSVTRPSWVNLAALDKRLNRPWRTLVRSACITPNPGASSICSVLAFFSTSGLMVEATSSIIFATSKFSKNSSILPASILDKSRMSLMSASRCLPAALIFSRSPLNSSSCSVGGFLVQHLGVAQDGVERRAQLVAHIGQKQALGLVGGFGGFLGLGHLFLDTLAFRDVAGDGAHAPQFPVTVVEGSRVVGHHGFLAVPGVRGELVVGDFAFAQHQLDGRLGSLRVGEVVLERCADQLVARASGERLHLLVNVGDDAARVGGYQCVNVGFNKRARVELLIAHALIEQHSLGFDLLTSLYCRCRSADNR